jgi:hypothetical protein
MVEVHSISQKKLNNCGPSVEHFEHFRKSGGHWVNLGKMEIGLAPLGEIGQ